MKCPGCGCEMAEGHLYCEKCGMEIQMVPDFEPEIENSIIETLSTVAEEIEGNEPAGEDADANSQQNQEKAKASVEDLKSKEKDNERKNRISFVEEQRRNRLILSLVTVIAVIVAGVFVTVSLYHRFSVSYQIEKAREYAGVQNYEMAVEYLEKAKILEDDASEIIFLESGYYYQMGEKQKAADVLIKLVKTQQPAYEDRERAYENIVAIYSEDGRYEDINALLAACEDDNIKNHFQQYMAMTPEFGYASGNYDEVISLKLSANTAGKIYYTMDGTNPDINSDVYTAPLFLESGEYQIAAMFVNDYGIKSEIVRNWYVINLMEPEPPVVSPLSGDYNLPVMIEAGVPESGTVYYTTDGANPGKDSLQYTEPIPMPLGRTNFKFVTISAEGVPSEIVSRSYDFMLETDVTVDKAVSNVVQALYNRKVLTDLQGHSHEIKGKYVFKYDTIVEIPGLGYYYVLKEYVEDDNGAQTVTEHLYAVEVYTGAPNRLIYDENGQMGLISLQ